MILLTGSFLDSWFRPFITQSPTLVVFLFSVALAFLSVVTYKYTTNQKVLKELKEKMNNIQKKMKDLRKDFNNKESQKEITRLNTELVKISGQQMKHSMRSTLFTLIPFLLLFGWLAAHYTYMPLYPNQTFNVTLTSMNNIQNLSLETVPGNLSVINKTTQKVAMKNNINNIYYIRTFTLRGPSGKYSLNFKKGNDTMITKNIIITTNSEYTKQKEVYKDKGITLTVSNKPLKMKLLGISMSWFWYYFIITVIFSSIFRKLLKVY